MTVYRHTVYRHTVNDRIVGDFPAKCTKNTPYIINIMPIDVNNYHIYVVLANPTLHNNVALGYAPRAFLAFTYEHTNTNTHTQTHTHNM